MHSALVSKIVAASSMSGLHGGPNRASPAAATIAAGSPAAASTTASSAAAAAAAVAASAASAAAAVVRAAVQRERLDAWRQSVVTRLTAVVHATGAAPGWGGRDSQRPRTAPALDAGGMQEQQVQQQRQEQQQEQHQELQQQQRQQWFGGRAPRVDSFLGAASDLLSRVTSAAGRSVPGADGSGGPREGTLRDGMAAEGTCPSGDGAWSNSSGGGDAAQGAGWAAGQGGAQLGATGIRWTGGGSVADSGCSPAGRCDGCADDSHARPAAPDPSLAATSQAGPCGTVPAAAAAAAVKGTGARPPSPSAAPPGVSALHPASPAGGPSRAGAAGSGAPAVSAGVSGSSGSASGSGVTHLVVMANGLFGSPSNWSVICEQLREHLDMSAVLLHPSQVNRLTDTYDGIDVCGQRLADEIRRVAAEHPSLQRISVIGHSMGGLLLRYAIGALYNPASGRVAGLRPVHFISLATPHLGCDADGLAQVPFIGWVPMKPVQKVLQGLSIPTAGLVFRRTGRQFFLADGSSSTTTATAGSSGSSGGIPSSSNPGGGGSYGFATGAHVNGSSVAAGGATAVAARAVRTAATSPPSPSAPPASRSAAGAAGSSSSTSATTASAASAGSSPLPPLLYRLTRDETDRGLHFYSALSSFASRTAYANTDGDHLVGWANSSLRFLHQLPQLPPEAARARGVVLQDPLLAAFDVRLKPQPEPQSASSRADVPIDLDLRPDTTPVAPGGGHGGPDAAGASKGGPGAKSRSPAAAETAAAEREARDWGTEDEDWGATRAAVMAGIGVDGSGGGGGGVERPSSAAGTAAMAEVMLRRLQRLPWRRIDVSFRGALFGFAHNNIQVTRRWLNFEGMAVAHHLARQLVALDAEWARREQQQQGPQQQTKQQQGQALWPLARQVQPRVEQAPAGLGQGQGQQPELGQLRGEQMELELGGSRMEGAAAPADAGVLREGCGPGPGVRSPQGGSLGAGVGVAGRMPPLVVGAGEGSRVAEALLTEAEAQEVMRDLAAAEGGEEADAAEGAELLTAEAEGQANSMVA